MLLLSIVMRSSKLGPRVFISYKRDHAETALVLTRVSNTLQEHGYSPLIDSSIDPGNRWSDELYRWILECAGAIVLASPEARLSDWCQREWHILAARAAVQQVRVIPICIGLDRAELGPLSQIQAFDCNDKLEETVIECLRDLPTHQVSTDDFLALHHAWLRYQFYDANAIRDERFSLRQVYIETECAVGEWAQVANADPFCASLRHRQSVLTATLEYISNPSFNEPIIVQGPAGAGKSAFTLCLANELIDQGLEPLLIRFRDLRLALHDRVDELLVDGIRVGPVQEQHEAPAPDPGLLSETRLRRKIRFRDYTISRTVVILDGWDEVSLASSAGYQAQLSTWLPRIRQFFVNRTGPAVRVVVTGRPSIEVKDSGFLFRRTPVLTLQPIRPEQLSTFCKQVSEITDWNLHEKTIKQIVDDYKVWFREQIVDEYRGWFRERKAAGLEMVGLPLLAMLSCRTLANWSGSVEELLSSRTSLYAALINQTVAHSGKGEPVVDEGSVHRSYGLRPLLHRTASMISIFFSERISFEELRLRLEEEGNEELENWVEGATHGNPLQELVVNFYFKGGRRELGCEFLHKSFREYLFAEAIVEEIDRLSSGKRGPIAPPDIPYWQDFPEHSPWFEPSRFVSKFLAPQWLAPEVRNHLYELIKERVSSEPERWMWVRDIFADLYEWWAEGKHLRPQPVVRRGQRTWELALINWMAEWATPYEASVDWAPARLATLDAHLGDALLQLTTILHRVFPGDENRIRIPVDAIPGYYNISKWQPTEGRSYQLESESLRIFVPGGQGFGQNLRARINVAVRRPEGPIQELAEWNLYHAP